MNKADSKGLKALREALGIEQSTFARDLGVMPSLVSGCEHGSKALSRQFCIKIGNIAARHNRVAEAIAFWEKGGLDLAAVRCVVAGLPHPKPLLVTICPKPEKLIRTPEFAKALAELVRCAQRQFVDEQVEYLEGTKRSKRAAKRGAA